MHAPEVTYDPAMPKEIREAARPIVAKWLWLAPSWVRTLWVSNDNASDKYASVTTDYCYRRASIFISPSWLGENDGEREHWLVHEFAHLFQSPLVDWIEGLIERVTDEGSVLAKELDDRLHEHCEGATVDLTRALLEGPASMKHLGSFMGADIFTGSSAGADKRWTDALEKHLGEAAAFMDKGNGVGV